MIAVSTFEEISCDLKKIGLIDDLIKTKGNLGNTGLIALTQGVLFNLAQTPCDSISECVCHCPAHGWTFGAIA